MRPHTIFVPVVHTVDYICRAPAVQSAERADGTAARRLVTGGKRTNKKDE